MTVLGFHRCRASDNCVGHTTEGPALTSAPDTICSGCVTKIQTQLGELPHLQDALESFKRPSLVGSLQSKVSATATPPAPINLTVVDLISDIWRAINRAGGLTVQVGALITEPAESFAVWWGGRRGERMLDGVERALDIGAVWRRADRIVGFSRQWVDRHAPCLRCGHRSLGMFVGENSIHCTNEACGKVYSLDDYVSLCIKKAALEKIEKKKEKKK